MSHSENALIQRVQLNGLSFDELLPHYIETGFLYEKKARRLEPLMASIRETWQKMLSAGDDLVQVYWIRHSDQSMTSIVQWRCTNTCWQIQHLCGPKKQPFATHAVMVECAARPFRGETRLEQGPAQVQNHSIFYDPSKEMPRRVFFPLRHSVPGELVSLFQMALFDLAASNKRRETASAIKNSQVEPIIIELIRSDDNQSYWRQMLISQKGPIWFESEELDQDIELVHAQSLFSKVSLERFRKVFVARTPEGACLGVAIVNRAPIGISFSLLDNRIELILASDSLNIEKAAIAAGLIRHSREALGELPESALTVLAEESLKGELEGVEGLSYRRSYHQNVWPQSAVPGVLQHLDGLYQTLSAMVAAERSSPSAPSRPTIH